MCVFCVGAFGCKKTNFVLVEKNNSEQLTELSHFLILTMLFRPVISVHSLALRSSGHAHPRFRIGSLQMGSKFSTNSEYPIVCDAHVMCQKAHGTCPKPVMENLRWNCDNSTADNICCFNRHFAEHSGYFEYTSSFLKEVDRNAETTYYDSVTGKPLFIAPRGRTFSAFLTVRSHIALLSTRILCCDCESPCDVLSGISKARMAKFS